ncbi:adhesion G protein-coupled receptor L4-like [Ylistrum balloti]|uniref:adhesion G protein-coupled receptor L4-like n=1 Tax=Ylistrum balloti TaxID=509963 RepID=UPI002905DB89|nr:adhesion G protein-coupled receptor L4-like [Ylistrum balloti]
MSTPLQCRNRIEAGERINITITHYTSFYIKKVVNRFDLESKLIKLTNSTITRPSNTSEIEIAIETHSSALELPGKIVMLDFESNCFRVKQREFEYNRNAYRLKLVSKLLLCPRVKLSNDRFEIDESSRRMTLLPHGPVLPFGNYEILANSTVSVCVEDFVAMMDGRTFEKEDQNLLSTILSIVSFVFTCLSLLCLVITFLTYCFFPELRTLPGKNNMCLIFSLFVSQCLTQFGMMRTEHTVPCMIIAVFLHFFWLSAFFSMNICSFHMFRVFVFPLKEARRNHRWTCFWYICYVFGMSALIVIVYISLSVVVFESDNLGYTGNGKCFLSSFESVIVTFISPVVVVCVSNVIFFAVVAFKISTAPKVPSNKSIRQEFPLYVKLFVLTGATWILQILDAFMPLSVFSIISGILNSSQGIFIFLSYSTNGRVRKFYKERLSSTRSTSISNKREFSAIPKTTSCQNDEKTVTDSSL